MSKILQMETQLKVVTVDKYGSRLQLISHGEESAKFSSKKYHSITAVKEQMKLDPNTADRLKSDILTYGDYFHIDSIYFEKNTYNATMTNPRIYENTQTSRFLNELPHTTEPTGSITYTIDKRVIDSRAQLFVDNVAGYDVFIIGRIYNFDSDIRRKIFQDRTMGFDEATTYKNDDYYNTTRHYFGADCPLNNQSNEMVTNFDGKEYQDIVCPPGKDVVQFTAIRIYKSDTFNKNIRLNVGDYTIPLNILLQLPQYCTEEESFYTITIPSNIIGYIPTMAPLKVHMEGRVKYALAYTTYTTPIMYKQEVPRKFGKLYQSFHKHTDIKQSATTAIDVKIGGKGLAKGILVESDILDDIVYLSIFMCGVVRLHYDMKLMKHYMCRLSPTVYYLPFSATNDFEKTGRETYQTALHISDVDMRIYFRNRLENDVTKKISVYSICLASMDYNTIPYNIE